MLKNFSIRIASVVIVLMATGCIEFLEVDLPGEEPRLIIEALLSDRESFSKISIGWGYASGTLCGSNDPFADECEADMVSPNPKVRGIVKIAEENGSEFVYNFQMADRQGYARLPISNSLTGEPGKRYTMDVEITYQGKTTVYHAESMMRTTPSISSITYEIRKGEIGKSDDFVPLISFNEPSASREYYLFTLCSFFSNAAIPSAECSGNSRVWNYSVLPDTFLPANVINLSIDNGATVAKYADFYPAAEPGYTIAEVHMYSIDKVTYEFYKSLLDQFNDDGGAYSPSPGTPVGNFNNGAIGIFSAIQLSYARV
jgi:hypothetical protein